MDSKFVRGTILLALLFFALGAEDSLSERRKRVEDMPEAQREELFRNEDKLHALAPQERERIDQLHEQLESVADGARLRETMNRYCQWISSLPPYRRAELQNMEPEQRVKHIKQLLKEQTLINGSRLGDIDRQSVVRWMDRYSTEHEARLLEVLGDNWRRQASKFSPPMQHRAAMNMSLRRWQSNTPAAQPPISESEMSDLRTALTPAARKILDSKASAERLRVISNWLSDAARQEMSKRRGESMSLLPGFDEQLADFFEFQVSADERDRLMSLPGEEMQQRLRDLYILQSKQTDPQRGDRPNWHGKRPGGPPPGVPNGRPKRDKDEKESRSGKGTASPSTSAVEK